MVISFSVINYVVSKSVRLRQADTLFLCSLSMSYESKRGSGTVLGPLLFLPPSNKIATKTAIILQGPESEQQNNNKSRKGLERKAIQHNKTVEGWKQITTSPTVSDCSCKGSEFLPKNQAPSSLSLEPLRGARRSKVERESRFPGRRAHRAPLAAAVRSSMAGHKEAHRRAQRNKAKSCRGLFRSKRKTASEGLEMWPVEPALRAPSGRASEPLREVRRSEVEGRSGSPERKAYRAPLAAAVRSSMAGLCWKGEERGLCNKGSTGRKSLPCCPAQIKQTLCT